MIKIGKYSFNDWKGYFFEKETHYVRNIQTDSLPILNSIIEVSINYFLIDDDVKLYNWYLSFSIYDPTIYEMFCLIHGNDFNRGLTFETAEDAKAFVDNTLEKIIKLRAFL